MDLEESSGPRKRFLALACGIFLGVYAGALALQWGFLRDQAVAGAERTASALAELLAVEIHATAPLAETLDHLDDRSRYRALHNLLTSKLGKFDVKMSKIYDRDGRVLFADDPQLLGQVFAFVPLFQEALAGATVSRLITPSEYAARYGAPLAAPLVETYLPLEEGRGLPVRYVLETYWDFGPTRSRLLREVGWSAASLALVMGLALGGLAWAYRRIHRLQSQVRALEGLLPICAGCKKVRVEGEGAPARWLAVEAYFGERDSLEFTHGMCPECVEKFREEAKARRASRGVPSGGLRGGTP